MAWTLFLIVASTLLISAMSLVGLVLFGKKMASRLHYIIAFAAATLLSVAFFDLIPEAVEAFEAVGNDAPYALVWVLSGVILFFLIERFIHWHHCGSEDCHDKPAGMLILTGDFVHNFLDGLLIAGAYLLDVRAGILATLSIIAHEIPQEVGDFSVLLHAGYSRKRALLLNFYSALSAIIGGVIGFLAFSSLQGVIPFIVAVAAGGFLYIALSDIVPALHRHAKEGHVLLLETTIFLVTLGVFFVFLFLLGHAH